MPAPQNTLKARLAARETTVGIWLGTGEAYLAEMAAHAGFDWLLIDGEHAPNGIRSLSAQIAVVQGKGPAPVLRLVDDNPAGIKQALDIGAQTLLIPMVDNVAQAERIVRAALYPPRGFRGVGSAMARASQFNGIADYLVTANDQICLILQLESLKGLQALAQIAALPGVDGLFIGPSDLAADMGYLGQAGHPVVKAAVLQAIRDIRAAGKAAGVLTLDPEFIRECQAAGANFLGVGVDVTSHMEGLRALARDWVGAFR